ncbi:MAG: hypothetical protein HZA59_14205 [Hydrogenophilales bacterium]|nr:hypothetical protein [Hydrogenophilales bacterium]
MSTYVMGPNFGLFDGLGVPVAGDFAKSSVRKTLTHLAESKKVRVASAAAFNDLHLLAQENGIRVADSNAFLLAQRFLLALPSHFPLPELALDDDGEVTLDWRGDKGSLLSLTLRDDGRLSFAARFSAFDKDSGTKKFDNSIPKQVIELVQRVTQA